MAEKVHLTLDLLEKLIPYATDKARIKFLVPLQTTLERYSITSIARASAFLAQITHESGSLRYVEEIASGSAYDHRSDLGNTCSDAVIVSRANGTTPGKFYKGHGLIQITGYYNHKAAGIALGVNAINNPRILCDPLYAALSAGWFWDTHNCNALADVLLFDKITKVINGGYNGLAERTKYYERNLQILG